MIAVLRRAQQWSRLSLHVFRAEMLPVHEDVCSGIVVCSVYIFGMPGFARTPCPQLAHDLSHVHSSVMLRDLFHATAEMVVAK